MSTAAEIAAAIADTDVADWASQDAGEIVGGAIAITETVASVGMLDFEGVRYVSVAVIGVDGHRAAWLTPEEFRAYAAAVALAAASLPAS